MLKGKKFMRAFVSLLLVSSLILSTGIIANADDVTSQSPPKSTAGEKLVAPVKLEGLKILEVLTSAGAGYVGRNHVRDGLFTDDQRGQVRPGTDTLTTNYITNPRELDDYHLAGIYGNAGVPYEIKELLLTEADAEKKYGAELPKYQALAKEISNEVYAGLTDGKGVFVVGTNCAPAVGVAGGMRRAYGDDVKLGLIYMDAHGDVNTRVSTFSGSMGGMDVAPILGLDQEDWWQAAAGDLNPFDAAIHACGRDLDSGVDIVDGKEVPFGELLNLKEAGANVVDVAQYNDEKYWRAQVEALANQVDVLYLHIDADVVDNAFLPNVNTPAKEGPDIWTVMRNIQIVMDTDKVAVVNLASIFFGRNYEDNKERLEKSQGFVFPDFPGETPEQATNRASQISILSGIRMISAAFDSWDNVELPVAVPEPAKTDSKPVNTEVRATDIVELG